MKNISFCVLSTCILIMSCNNILPKKDVFTITVLGDMPYSLPKDYGRFDTLINLINKDSSQFTVFIGDFKSSQTPCSDSAFLKIKSYFNQFKKPLVYTPGDNEWTDCGNVNAGSYNPNERLSFIRRNFFSKELNWGHSKLSLVSQSSLPDYADFKENAVWKFKGFCFASIHVVGSNNHFNSVDDSLNLEFNVRQKADLFWLKSIFKIADEENSPGLIIFMHADIFTASKGYSGFVNFLHELKIQCLKYKKPVLIVNGDSHKFLNDRPFGKAIPNLERMQVSGDKDMRAFRIKIDLNSPKPWQIDSAGIGL